MEGIPPVPPVPTPPACNKASAGGGRPENLPDTGDQGDRSRACSCLTYGVGTCWERGETTVGRPLSALEPRSNSFGYGSVSCVDLCYQLLRRLRHLHQTFLLPRSAHNSARSAGASVPQCLALGPVCSCHSRRTKGLRQPKPRAKPMYRSPVPCHRARAERRELHSLKNLSASYKASCKLGKASDASLVLQS